MRELIRNIIHEHLVEQKESKVNSIWQLIDRSGYQVAAKMVGGYNNLINLVYNGDIKEFADDNEERLCFIRDSGMSMYLHEALVEKLDLDNTKIGGDKILGTFRFGSPKSHQYSIRVSLTKDRAYYRVIGMSGDYGFGLSFINKKNQLGKRARQQVFKQIIDKYNLQEYM